jgi:hypothetical protein
MRNVCIVRDTGLSVEETEESGACPSSVLKYTYLGVNYKLSGDLESGVLIDKLVRALSEHGLFLKPLQKIKLILEGTTRKFSYGLFLGNPEEIFCKWPSRRPE